MGARELCRAVTVIGCRPQQNPNAVGGGGAGEGCTERAGVFAIGEDVLQVNHKSHATLQRLGCDVSDS